MTEQYAESVASLPRIPVHIEFVHGWCKLTLGSEPNQTTLPATTMHNAFADLLLAVARIRQGGRCQNAQWGGEGRGWFIDLSSDVLGGVGIAVHTMRDPEWFIVAERWRPVRHDLVYEEYGPLSCFAEDLVVEARRVRDEYADSSGYMAAWGWAFPEDEFGALVSAST